MAESKNILVVTKNGNFVKAVSNKAKAVTELRSLLASDLKIKAPDAKVIEKNGVVSIDGTPHYRAKHVVVS